MTAVCIRGNVGTVTRSDDNDSGGSPDAQVAGGLRDGGNGYLEEMLSVVQAARVVTGSILIIAGLIAIPLPLTPGLPLIIIGLAFGFSWHPKGLRLLRRCKVKWGRLFKKKTS